MGGGGGGQNTVTRVDVPPWMAAAGMENYEFAKQITSQPYQGYTGERVAGFSPTSYQVFDRIAGMQGQGAAQIGEAQNATRRALAYSPLGVSAGPGPQQVTAGGFLDADVNAYMNPYVQSVEQAALANLDTERLKALNQTGDQAIASGAFGGSRHAIMEAVTNANAAKAAGELSAQLRAQAYDDAASRVAADQNRALQAALSNQQAGLAYGEQSLQAQAANQQAWADAQRIYLGAGEQLGNLANTGQQMTGREIALLDTVAQQQRGLEQARLDDAYARFLEAANYPAQMLALRNSALSMTPYNQTQTTSQNYTGGGNPITGAVGGAMTGASIASALGASSGWGALGGGVLGALAASDDDLKTDIARVGEDPETGLGIFTFRYKDDAPNTPKVLGLMAEEVQQKFPEAVREVGGVKGILGSELPPHLRALATPSQPKVDAPKRGKRKAGR